MANENTQITVEGIQDTGEKNILAKLKGFFQKSKKDGKHSTRVLHFTRRDAIITLLIAFLIAGGSIYYGKVVLSKYFDLNNRSLELYNFEAYGISPNNDKLLSYTDGSDIENIRSLIEVNSKIQEEKEENLSFNKQQKSYYDVLLKKLYLPSLNIWKDPYTQHFNMSIMGQKYLEEDKFQDLYLHQFWSDFVRVVGNDVDYNSIESISIGDRVEDGNEDPEYFHIPITVSFSSPNKRAFLLFVNKISTTSNQANIALLNELFFYLFISIREQKSAELEKLMQDYRNDFSSSYNWTGPSNFTDLDGDELTSYRDWVIGYNLYRWIEDDLEDTKLIDDDIIVEVIRNVSSCDDLSNNNLKESNKECFYNFREKYRNLPYLAYKVGLENQTNRKKGLLEFLQSLPPIIAITDFGFEKHSDSNFLNNEEGKYNGTISFNVYGTNILSSELDEASSMLGKLCFGNSSDLKISPSLALNRINEILATYGEERKYKNVLSLGELQTLFTEIQESYDSMSNYDKMVKLFEIWRMMDDGNLCNK